MRETAAKIPVLRRRTSLGRGRERFTKSDSEVSRIHSSRREACQNNICGAAVRTRPKRRCRLQTMERPLLLTARRRKVTSTCTLHLQPRGESYPPRACAKSVPILPQCTVSSGPTTTRPASNRRTPRPRRKYHQYSLLLLCQVPPGHP